MSGQDKNPSWTESERLAALDRYAILDTLPEQDFDDLARMAADLLGVPIAVVNLIAAKRQWFKAEIGLGVREMPLDVSICARMLLSPGEFVVPDLADDARFARNPLVTAGLGLRFYAGALLETPEGLPLGTLCVLDTHPRPEGLTARQHFALRTLARQVMSQMELRRAVAERDASLAEQRRTASLNKQIIDSSTDHAVIATDLEGRVMRWNAGAEHVLGWSEREMLGQTADRFFTPEDRALDRVAVEMRSALETGRGNDERWHLRKNGQRFWASGAMTPLRTEGQEVAGFVKVMRDQTEQHRSIEALRLAEADLRRAQEAGRVGVFTVGVADGVLHATPEFCRLYGLPEDSSSFPAETFERLIIPEDSNLVSTASMRRAGAALQDVEYRIRRADTGELRWIARRAEFEHDAQGHPVRFVGVARDITEQRCAQQAVESSDRRYRTLIETIETGFCIVVMRFDEDDRAVDYRIVESNPAFERMTGLIDAKGRWISEIAPTLERHWFDTYGRVALTGEAVRFENAAEAFNRWYDVQALRLGAPEERQVAILFNDISDRRRAELALARSEAHWRGLFERLDEGFILGKVLRDERGMVTDWRYLEVNLAWGKLVGIAPDMAASRTIRDLFPGIEDEWIAEMARVVETGHPATFTRQVGDLRRWYEGRAHHVDGDHFAVIFIEVTERVQAEARRNALLLLGDRLRDMQNLEEMAFVAAELMGATLDVSRAGYGTISADGEVLSINRSWAHSGAAGITGEFRLRDFGTYVADLWRGETVVIGDIGRDPRTVDKAAELASVEARAIVNLPLVEEGRFVALFFVNHAEPRSWTPEELAFMRNVAERTRSAIERRRAEAELREIAASLEQQVEERTRDRNRMWRLSTDIMLVADFTARIEAMNPAWTSLLGWTADDLLGGDFMSLVHPEDVGPTLAEVGKLADGITTLRFENRYRHKDGSYRWLSWTAVPDEHFIHAVGRDIQAEKDATEALRHTEDVLRQSQKMEAVGQLTGGLAHDFNNLLTGITGSLELLGTRVAQERYKDVDRYVHAAQGAAKRAAALTHRLLAFSRQQTLDPRPTDPNRLVAGMEELLRRTVGPSIEVEVVAAGGLWPTLVDPNQLENALLNLCINARDAMPDGGRLTIETSNTWLDSRAAKERDLPPGQYVAICVTDTGTGMPPAVVAKAFDPFFTTKPLGQGTGLGLSMIYGFARQSGGQIRIYSEPGQGTTMRLYLPRHLGEVEEPEDLPDLAEAPRARAGETVLVVDDEPTVRMLVMEVLEELGYAAIEAADGASGLGVLRSDARVDLLVTDVGLPGGMSGRQMADMARVVRPDLKVLFITGYAENAVVGNGHLEPGMHVMTKPFAMEALAGRIKELITAR